MRWFEGWQGGLVLGAALSLLLDFGVSYLIRWFRYRARLRGVRQCDYCRGELDEDGFGVGAVHKLVFCPHCFDTVPSSGLPMQFEGERKFEYVPVQHWVRHIGDRRFG